MFQSRWTAGIAITAFVALDVCLNFADRFLGENKVDSLTTSQAVVEEKVAQATHQNVSSLLPLTLSNVTTRDNGLCENLYHYSVGVEHPDTEASRTSPLWTTPSLTWEKYETLILNSSFEEGAEDIDKEYVRQLFRFTTTERLRRGTSSIVDKLPSAINRIIEKRMQDPVENPPLTIAVLGGSVTAGHRCRHSPIRPSRDSQMVRHVQCAWPYRLERLINNLFDMEIVKIINMAVAGTTSDVGSAIVKYEIWPDSLTGTTNHGPHLIIAAYSTNDSLLPDTNVTFQNIKALIESVQGIQDCDTELPALILYEDWVSWGGSHKFWMDRHSDVWQLARYYGIMAVSYEGAFGDAVLANLANPYFSGKKLDTGRNDVHPGTSFHITSAWLFAFAFLSSIMNDCTEKRNNDSTTNPQIQDYSQKFGIPDIPHGPKPSFTLDLKSDNIGQLWRHESKKYELQCSVRENKGASACSFIWLPNLRRQDFTSLNPFITHNNGWVLERPEKSKNKPGMVAQQSNATFGLIVHNLTTPVTVVNVFSMLSYGAAWNDSYVKMTVNNVTSFTWAGFHDSKTSIIVQRPFQLNHNIALNTGDSVSLEFELISGATFKIAGLSLCSK